MFSTRTGMFSIRKLIARSGSACAIAAACGLALASTSCGGGGGVAAKPMVLVEFLFVDRSLTPSFPTGVQALPRNAQIVFEFSELVDPASVNEQTIAIRFGSQFQSIPKGSFQVDSSAVIFDPTVSAQGTPNPFGLEPVTQYNVELPAVTESNDVVENLDNDPLLTSFFSNFTTSDGYLRELNPPSILRAYFIPDQDTLTRQVPGNAILGLEFSEAIDPASIILAGGLAPTLNDTIDIRYNDLDEPNINSTNGLELSPIIGVFTHNPAATTYFFTPTFSWGNKKFIFSVQVFQGITDLSGNLLVNPRSFGPFTCDGNGIATGKILTEGFDTLTDEDPAPTSGDWGFTTPSQLQGAPIVPRRTYIAGYQLTEQQQGGQYNPIVDPLTGAQLNQFIQNINPPTADGRRVMWAFADYEMGQEGSITTASWGPDSNATFAAQYPTIILRVGFQKTASLSLATTFTGNYLGSPLILYKGSYSVTQSAAVPDEYATPVNTTQFQTPCVFPPPVGTLQCLYDFRGYVDWPTPTSYFDWDQGDPAVDLDRVLVFDASVQEGDTFQQIRGWFGVTAPNSGLLIGGFPTRRMYATYEEDFPNPASNFVAGIVNPEPSLTDTAFTITKRVSFAQTRFYTPSNVDAALNVYPPPYSGQKTFGVKSNYNPAILTPSVQAGGATILIEYQGAIALDASSNRTKINTVFPSTPFTTNVNDCDGYPYMRWRITLTSNLISNKVAKVTGVNIPVLSLP